MAAVTELKVIELDQCFVKEGRVGKHRPTEDLTWATRLEKVANFATAWFFDWWEPQKVDAFRLEPQSPEARLVEASLESRVAHMSTDRFFAFYNALKKEYPDAPVELMTQGLYGVLPYEAMTQDFEFIPDGRKTILAYPFIYSACSMFSVPHIVLILVNQASKEIYYYDPNGLTSDDPSRASYRMRESLKNLGELVFQGDKYRLIDNRAQHQIDTMSCGIFVATALWRLFEGKTVDEALTFECTLEAALTLRKLMGLFYLRAEKIDCGDQF